MYGGAILRRLWRDVGHGQKFARGVLGVTTVNAIQQANGSATPAPTASNPYHAVLGGISPQMAEQLFTPLKFHVEVAMDSPNRQALPSEKELDQIRMSTDQTTPGPWKSYIEGREEMSGSDFIMTGGEDIYLTGATKADQDFIADARQDIPALVAEIERLRALLVRANS
jgi:hypothetical protein